MPANAAKPGRPRDPQADQAILSAARDLLAEGGLAALTVEGTANRAGVAKTTVYRRYPTKLDLAIAAVAALSREADVEPETDDSAATLTEIFERSLGSADAQAALLAVAGAAATDPEVHERFAQSVIEPTLALFAARLQKATQQGLISGGATPDFCYDVLVGTMLHRIVLRQKPPDEEFDRRLGALMQFLWDFPKP